MSAAPVAALLPHFQCASSSSFPPVPSSDPLLLSASPVHDSCFACLRSGMPSPSPPERKIPTCSLQIGIIQSWKILRRHGIPLFFGLPLFSAASRFAEPSICEYFPRYSPFAVPLSQFLFRSSLLWPLFCPPLFAVLLLWFSFCCGPLLWLPLLRPPFAAPLWLSPFAAPLSWPPSWPPSRPPSRPPGKGYFWNR